MNDDTAEFDPAAVRAFEHAGWERAAAGYADSFAPATTAFAEALLDAAAVGAGSRVLDLACGPGVVAAAATRRGATVVGLDFSAAMLAEARARHPGIRFDAGDAEALPYPAASFDAVVSNFGVHHVPRPARAVAEAWWVLRPGGRLAFTSWAAPAENLAWKLVLAAIAACGDADAADAPAPGGSLGTAAPLLRLLDGGGFAAAAAEPVRCIWPLATAASLVAALRQGTVRMAALLDAQSAAARNAIVAEIERQDAPYRTEDGLRLPIVALLAHGTRP